MCTCGTCRAAAACKAIERAISPPSSVTREFSAVFCDLNGSTFKPLSANSRQSPATIVVLPASELAAWIMIGFIAQSVVLGHVEQMQVVPGDGQQMRIRSVGQRRAEIGRDVLC